MLQLSVGINTYDDFDGVYFSVQSLRLHHDLIRHGDVEIIVLDNNPASADGQATRDFMGWVSNGHYVPYEAWKGTATRTLLFEKLAQGEIVVCADAHVLLQPGALESLVQFFEENPNCQDLIQGPMLYDDLRGLATHMDPVWRAQMWGIWGHDPRGADPASMPFEIPMHGLGLFACRRDAWLGFNHAFQGFGGEEGYIHEKFRQAGRRTLCLPGLRWLHRFPRPRGVPFSALLHDKIRNYFIGHKELGLDVSPIREHFLEFVTSDVLNSIESEANQLLFKPPKRPRPIRKLGTKSISILNSRIDIRTQPCKFLGNTTGKTVSCPTCRGNVQVKLFHCDVHKVCSSRKTLEGVACCLVCDQYQSSDEIDMSTNSAISTLL